MSLISLKVPGSSENGRKSIYSRTSAMYRENQHLEWRLRSGQDDSNTVLDNAKGRS